jgi:hypothetical protein
LGKLTIDEAWRNVNELKQLGFATEAEYNHYLEVVEMLSEDNDE